MARRALLSLFGRRGGGVIGPAVALPLVLCALLSPVGAQTAGQGQASEQQIIEVPSPILTLDWEELYAQSSWGMRVAAELDAASTALNRENTRIADGLVEEERSLTERRATMKPDAFRTEADAFDQRVIGIRRAQETKARSLAAQAEAERNRFISAAIGLLDGMIEARGAVVVIDRRAIIRGAGAVDVTAEMVTRVDATLGDGASAQAPAVPDAAATEPAQSPDPQPTAEPQPMAEPKPIAKPDLAPAQ